MQIIAVDYDNTYSDDEDMWRQLVEIMKKRGHLVVMVTARPPEDPINNVPLEIFYTSSKPKAEFMRGKGLEIDVWIDDWPELIGKTR